VFTDPEPGAGFVMLAQPHGLPPRAAGAARERKAFSAPAWGYPAEDAEVPDLERKPLEEIAVWK
jgi:hypothetical protein